MAKSRTVVNIYRLTGTGNSPGDKKHYKSITIPRGALTVWKAFVTGMTTATGLDIEALRSQRKRKGGK